MFGIASQSKLYIAHYKKIYRIFDSFSADSFDADADNKKAFPEKILDYLYIFFKLKIMPDNYHLFGFKRKKRDEFKHYLGETWNEPFITRKIGKLWGNGIILRDKLTFKIICEYHHLPIPRNYGLLKYGKLNGGLEETLAQIECHQPKKLVLKPVLGQNGVGIQFIEPEQIEAICTNAKMHREVYLIEEAIEQHPELNKINPNSVNSIRLITFLRRDGNVELLSGMLKTSASKVPVDNFNLGGIAVGIDLETGKVKSDGYAKFYSPDAVIDNRKSTDQETIQQILDEIKDMQSRYPGKLFKHHPLTNFKFEGFQLPYWADVIAAAVKAQQVFYHGKAIAWDIAITAKGPVIIEGNEGWGTSAIQATNGGLLTEKNKNLFSQYGIKFY